MLILKIIYYNVDFIMMNSVSFRKAFQAPIRGYAKGRERSIQEYIQPHFLLSDEIFKFFQEELLKKCGINGMEKQGPIIKEFLDSVLKQNADEIRSQIRAIESEASKTKQQAGPTIPDQKSHESPLATSSSVTVRVRDSKKLPASYNNVKKFIVSLITQYLHDKHLIEGNKDRRKIRDERSKMRAMDSLSRLLAIEINPCTAVTIVTPQPSADLTIGQMKNEAILLVAINSKNHHKRGSKKKDAIPNISSVNLLVQKRFALVQEFVKEISSQKPMSREALKHSAEEYIDKIIESGGLLYPLKKARLIKDLIKVAYRIKMPTNIRIILPKNVNGKMVHAEQAILSNVLESIGVETIQRDEIVIGISKLACGDCDEVLQEVSSELEKNKKEHLESGFSIAYRGASQSFFRNIHRLRGKNIEGIRNNSSCELLIPEDSDSECEEIFSEAKAGPSLKDPLVAAPLNAKAGLILSGPVQQCGAELSIPIPGQTQTTGAAPQLAVAMPFFKRGAVLRSDLSAAAPYREEVSQVSLNQLGDDVRGVVPRSRL